MRKPIKDYEGLYEIDDSGNIYSLRRKGRILKPCLINSGYLTVHLAKEKTLIRYLVHRLVALHFIDNPNSFPVVNHKDENKLNNLASNLEWCTYKHNINYGTGREKQRSAIMKPIEQYDLKGNFIREWRGCADVERELGFNRNNINSCVNGKLKTAYGFIWKKVN